MPEFIYSLEHLDRGSLGIAGGKGANLGELIKAGLPVPPGFVVTAHAYRTMLEAGGLPGRIAQRLAGLQATDLEGLAAAAADVAAWILATPLPAPIKDAVVEAYRDLSGGAVAVRSSATAEDLPDASFAGQQETFLHISGAEAVLEHVRKCWASLWTPQATSYRASMGYDHLKVDLAVVVQKMVAADVAGVMFTANPVSGARDEILISASYGLGESVVSGAVTPDTFVVTAGGTVKQRTLGSKETRILPAASGTRTEPVPAAERSRSCLTDKELAGLAALAQKVQAHYGAPQDTEWALAGGKLSLLQARPITTMKADAEPDPDWDPEILFKGKRLPFTVSLEYFPEPPTPLDAYQFELKAFDNFFAAFGVKPPKNPTGPVERRDGRVALTIGQARISPSIIWRLPGYIRRAMRTSPAEGWAVVEAGMKESLARNKAIEQKTNAAPALARILTEMPFEFDKLFEGRLHATFAQGIISDVMVGYWVRRAVGKQAAKEMKARLFRALPFRTALQNLALGRLARVAATHGKESPEFSAAMKQFLAEYGDRPSRGFITMPSIEPLREKPEVVVGLVDSMLGDPSALEPDEAFRRQDSDFQAAKAEVESRLRPGARRRFLKNLEWARTAIIARDECLYLSERIIAYFRHVAYRLGAAMVSSGVLSEPGDVFYLFRTELVPAATGAIPVAEVRTRVTRRKQAFARVTALHERGQHWLVTSGSIAKAPEVKRKRTNANELVGLAASRGVAEGVVCIVNGPQEFHKLKKGQILVAPFTAPVWTPLFRVAAAVVTDVGSPTSHAAIVAREYGMPAVVAAGNATAVLKDGQRVRVDGTKGIVTVIGGQA